jgi:hypothetical protein
MAGRTGRPNKNRKESKYLLPSGVTLKPGQASVYNKTTELIFIDEEFGEFTSSFKAITRCNASTHPKAIQRRREATNTSKYGVANPSYSKEVRQKAADTMVERYGVTSALKSDTFKEKAKKTLIENYGVDNPSKSSIVKDKVIQTNMDRYGVPVASMLPEIRQKNTETNRKKYGVDHPQQLKVFKEKGKQTNIERYGVEYPLQSPKIMEKMLTTMINGKGFYSSKGELEVKAFVESFGLECRSSFIGGSKPKQVDIKIDSLNLGIEYNGVYWHCEGNPSITPSYHLDKTKAAEAQGLDLIHIFDFEWAERQAQVKSFLQSKLGKNTIKYNARSLDLREAPKEEAQQFLDDYHILGSTRFIKAYGLYNKEELVALITIGKHHRNNTEIVLNRYVGKTNVTVRGGLSRLSQAAVKEFGEISTWVDRRFSNGKGWLACGWEVVSILPPDYFYCSRGKNKIVSKQSRRKAVVKTPPGMTEHEHAKLDGLYRVYDCGKIKLKIK